jgi:hypothetical protein
MKYKTLTTGFLSLLMLNIGFAPVFANPVIEQQKAETQDIQANSEQNSIILTPATPDTPGAVQIVPLKAYTALKGEASLEGKQLLEVYPESSSQSVGNKDLTKDNDKSTLPQEADYFVVLPEGEALSAEEMEQIEGEWWGAVIYAAGLAYRVGYCLGYRCDRVQWAFVALPMGDLLYKHLIRPIPVR